MFKRVRKYLLHRVTGNIYKILHLKNRDPWAISLTCEKVPINKHICKKNFITLIKKEKSNFSIFFLLNGPNL